LPRSTCIIVYVAVKVVLSLCPGAMKAMELSEIVASGCWTLDNKPNRLFAGNREPGFKAYMEAKDLSIVMDTAREYGIPLPSTAVNTQLFNALLEMGWAERENSAVVGVIEKLTDVKLKTQK